MTTNTATRAVTARRTIACPRDAVFRAWTDPEELIGWWGGEHVVLLSATVDLRVEGSYRLTVQSGDASARSTACIARSRRPTGSSTRGAGTPRAARNRS